MKLYISSTCTKMGSGVIKYINVESSGDTKVKSRELRETPDQLMDNIVRRFSDGGEKTSIV